MFGRGLGPPHVHNQSRSHASMPHFPEQVEEAMLEAALALSAQEAARSQSGGADEADAAAEEEEQLAKVLRLSKYEAWRASLPVSHYQVPASASQQTRDDACSSDAPLECPVCLGEFKSKDRILHLECLHSFHEACVDPWLEKHMNCPVCKTTFLEL